MDLIKILNLPKDKESKENVYLPLRLLLAGDWAEGMSAEAKKKLKNRKIHEIQSADDIDIAMDEMGVELVLKIEGESKPVKLRLRRREDLTPDRIVEAIPALKELLEKRRFLDEILGDPSLEEEVRSLVEEK